MPKYLLIFLKKHFFYDHLPKYYMTLAACCNKICSRVIILLQTPAPQKRENSLELQVTSSFPMSCARSSIYKLSSSVNRVSRLKNPVLTTHASIRTEDPAPPDVFH